MTCAADRLFEAPAKPRSGAAIGLITERWALASRKGLGPRPLLVRTAHRTSAIEIAAQLGCKVLLIDRRAVDALEAAAATRAVVILVEPGLDGTIPRMMGLIETADLVVYVET